MANNEKKRSYSTEGLNSRQEVQNALASAGYRPSESVTAAGNALKELQENRPGDYESKYQDRIDAALDDLSGKKDFSYNYVNDPLYHQYAQVYTQNAHNASADAAAQAAALTGGYGSSYAASVAQQAYQQQIGALNLAIPTLYQLALDTYDSSGDALVTRLDQLSAQEQNAQGLYNQKLSDYYTQLEQLGSAYNSAYQKDYGRYQDYLSRLNTLYGYYSQQEQQQAAKKQQWFNNAVTALGVVGDAVQLLVSGTTGLGSLAGSLLNTGYNIYANNRDYEADRADTAWNQQMQEKKYQDGLTQQQFDNTFAQQQYQDKLRQQQFTNDVTSQRLNIAKGEWALKQSKAAQQVQKASADAAAKSSTGQLGSTGGLTVGKSGVSSGGTVPYTAARMRSQGKNDAAIRTELLKEGYSSGEVARIMRQLNS
ncbi:cell envelope biogenesis protein TolA [Faecalibacterium prausnitzii]|uniref:Cell envelope biogenesis protein TolA n=1 Tax=Faecalibacterium prausnitzii TaxID=853 RepID=A0A2A7ANA5_9FIRM|nr:cell envelope biogenesis protein TolA [Faecalibacterium prausnitzii]PDX80521.1 cell envelope biogenesis protein TolA [Faecalibacterium prausnitzii]